MTDPRKPIFAAVRATVGHNPFNDPRNLAAFDNVLDALGVPRANLMRAGPKAKALVKKWEGCKLRAYPDPGTGGKPWTIGWGATSDEKGMPIKPGTVWTQARADARLDQTLEAFAADLRFLLGDAPTTQDQFDALLSFMYNVGADIDQDDIAEGLGDSTLLKKHLAGDYAGAGREFGKWINANGRPMNGLRNRRAEEAALYRGAA